MPEQLSPALRDLLDTGIDSFEKLEVVVGLHRDAARRGSQEELATALALGRDEMRKLVGELERAGLLARDGADTLVLAPQSAEASTALVELVRLYDVDKISLVKAILDRAMARLRNLAGRAFSDAFVIRKKPEGDDDA